MATRIIQASLEQRGTITLERCEKCFRHFQIFHMTEGPRDIIKCAGCLPESAPPLRRCGGCRVTLYCTRECQKAHWREHRGECQQVSGATMAMEREFEQATQCEAWCVEHSEELTHATKAAWVAAQRRAKGPASASLQRTPAGMQHWVCVVHIDIRVTQDKPAGRRMSFAQAVQEVRCRPFKEVSRLLEDTVLSIGPGLERDSLIGRLEHELEDIPGTIPVLFVNRYAKYPFKLCATRQSLLDKAERMQFDWVRTFRHAIDTRSAQVVSSPPPDYTRHAISY
ncbi:hypothetical protein BV25DRAFT_1903059 [Artomyces pyxidatus]|uniref:Uncharacterized protein n=1 Tax=Artomyces pyxidatus TaxID=48021 RepID=A0ACB8SL81_9AGAM|nr:hypothetical protein BV25DRAFT_1903059 [Artomyces pyxidatus]